VEPSADNYCDIVIVGAGLAGTTAAAVLGRQGWRITLVDPNQAFPAVFKAEKIEPDQVALLRKFELLDLILPRAGSIREVRAYYNGRFFGSSNTEQYGIYYSDMVNALRVHLPSTVQFVPKRVMQIKNSTDLQRVLLDDGQELTCRLIVLACGLNASIPLSLGLKRSYIQKHQSVALAFTIAHLDKSPFSFDSITYYSVTPKLGIDYLTLFPTGNTMRANLFAFPAINDPWVRKFIQNPTEGVQKCFPGLQRVIGNMEITSKVENALIHLYRTEAEPPPGVAVIGDAGENVCPSTGMGLTKIFTDVDVLSSECVRSWFSTAGMGVEKLASFFNHPDKCAVDKRALQNAFYRRQASIGLSLRWRIHRSRLHMSMRWKKPSVIVSDRA
jgi:2-polyprenyl-6-methoxyphenol hydroxylase-like FAD-dependent oxidoreductase